MACHKLFKKTAIWITEVRFISFVSTKPSNNETNGNEFWENIKNILPITGGLWVIKGVFTSSLRSWPAENTWPEWDRTMTRRSETSLFNSEYSPSSMASDSAFLRERNVLFNDALNTFYLWLYGREREREMFYLTKHSTHFIYGYMGKREREKCFI